MYSTRTVNDTFALLCLERGEKAGHAPRAHTKGFTAQPYWGWLGGCRVEGIICIEDIFAAAPRSVSPGRGGLV